MYTHNFRLLLGVVEAFTLPGLYSAYIDRCLLTTLENGTDRLSQNSVNN
jgi:hypothetical protein